MRFYVSKELGKVLTEKEYLELINRENKELKAEIEKLIESDTGFKFYDVNIENYEGSLLNLDNLIESELNTNESIFEGDTRTYIEEGTYSYWLCDGWYLDVQFQVIEEKENAEDTIVKVSGLDLI